MSETQKKFSTEQIRAFEDKYNIGVNNHEAMVELFMRQQEQIDEIAKNTPDTTECFEDGTMKHKAPWGLVQSLFDKWNNQ